MRQTTEVTIKRRAVEKREPYRYRGDGYRVGDQAALIAAIQAARWAIQDSLSHGAGKELVH
jgi:hypothetical protein